MKITAKGEFRVEGEPAENVTYRAKILAQASEEEIREIRNQHAP